LSSTNSSTESRPSDDRLDRIAALSNTLSYNAGDAESYIEGAPHLKHASLRKLFSKLLLDVFDAASKHADPPKVLDLGAGEGSATLQLLELGANVTAVDISSQQLAALVAKCDDHRDRLEVRCQGVHEALIDASDQFDIITLNSFLHHIPDYLSLIDKCLPKLAPGGILFSFQDPLRYDTVGRTSRIFTDIGYFFWRLSGGAEGDVIGGIARRLRRRRGVYRDDCPPDNIEYHIVRNGVDQIAIERLLKDRGFDCNIITYYSSQNTLFQPIGEAIGFRNLFSLIATRGQLPAELSPEGTQGKY
jgi:SAM-dependent methyltransferase